MNFLVSNRCGNGLISELMKLSIKDFFSKCEDLQETADLATFAEDILNGILHFLCSITPKWSFLRRVNR